MDTSSALVTWVLLEQKNYQNYSLRRICKNLRLTMRGRHGQRGWALLALFILLAASVVVDGGIEDYFSRELR